VRQHKKQSMSEEIVNEVIRSVYKVLLDIVYQYAKQRVAKCLKSISYPPPKGVYRPFPMSFTQLTESDKYFYGVEECENRLFIFPKPSSGVVPSGPPFEPLHSCDDFVILDLPQGFDIEYCRAEHRLHVGDNLEGSLPDPCTPTLKRGAGVRYDFRHKWIFRARTQDAIDIYSREEHGHVSKNEHEHATTNFTLICTIDIDSDYQGSHVLQRKNKHFPFCVGNDMILYAETYMDENTGHIWSYIFVLRYPLDLPADTVSSSLQLCRFRFDGRVTSIDYMPSLKGFFASVLQETQSTPYNEARKTKLVFVDPLRKTLEYLLCEDGETHFIFHSTVLTFLCREHTLLLHNPNHPLISFQEWEWS